MNVISPKLKFVMKIVFKPITTSALLSDDRKMPTLDSFCYMTSHMALLQSSPNMHFSTIYVQPFLNYAYSCDLNENGQMAQNEINPNLFNLLVDQFNFGDNFPHQDML